MSEILYLWAGIATNHTRLLLLQAIILGWYAPHRSKAQSIVQFKVQFIVQFKVQCTVQCTVQSRIQSPGFALTLGLPPPPPPPPAFCALQAIKNWRQGRPGNLQLSHMCEKAVRMRLFTCSLLL